MHFGTGNVLSAVVVEHDAAPFDERYNLIGGEDPILPRLRRNGHELFGQRSGGP